MKQTSKGWVGYYGQKTDRFIPFICEQGSTPEEVTDCCKEKKYDLIVRLDERFNPMHLTNIMTEHLKRSTIQTETTLDIINRTGSCILISDDMETISKLTPILVQNNIGFEVKISK